MGAGVGIGTGLGEGLQNIAAGITRSTRQKSAQTVEENNAEKARLLRQLEAIHTNLAPILIAKGTRDKNGELVPMPLEEAWEKKDPQAVPYITAAWKTLEELRSIHAPQEMPLLIAGIQKLFHRGKTPAQAPAQTEPDIGAIKTSFMAAPRPVDQGQAVLSRIRANVQAFKEFNPNATPEQTQQFLNKEFGLVTGDKFVREYKLEVGGETHLFHEYLRPDGTVRTDDKGKVAETLVSKQKISVRVPGETGIRIAWVDPKKPSGFVDEMNKPLPEGTKSVSEMEIRSLSYGTFGNYYRAAMGRGASDADARRIAGEQVNQLFGLTFSTMDQNIAIKEAESGIAGGKPPTIATPSTPAQPGAKTTPAGTAKPGATPTGGASPAEMQNIQFYLGTILGTQTATGVSKVRAIRGQQALGKLTGVDPMTLNANLAQDKATAKQLGETVQRAGAIQRLNNTLDLHGKVLEGVAKNIIQSGSPLLNTALRHLDRAAEGSPELKRFQIALNAVQREYAYLTAGGAQSRAMLPMTVVGNMEKMFSQDSTLAEIVAAVDQVRIEAKKETEALKKTQDDMIGNLTGGLAGRAVGGGVGAPKVGDVKTFPNGKKGKFDGVGWEPMK